MAKKKRDKQEFLLVKDALLKEEVWIIEGCSFSTLEMRFARADTLIYFHLPRWLCIWRVCKRLFTFEKRIGFGILSCANIAFSARDCLFHQTFRIKKKITNKQTVVN